MAGPGIPIVVVEKYPDTTLDLLWNIILKLGGSELDIEEKYFDTGDDLLYAILKLLNGGLPGGGSTGGMIRFISADFTDATHLDSVLIAGKDFAVYLNELGRFLEPTEFAATAGGVNILLPGFDATVNNYTVFIAIITGTLGGGGGTT